MTVGDTAPAAGDLRRLPRGERRQVRRAVRRGRKAQFPSRLAAAVVVAARRSAGRCRGVLAVAVVGILASAGAAAVVALQRGVGPLLVVPVVGLFLGGVAGVLSESRLRRAEVAGALAAQQVARADRPAGGSASTSRTDASESADPAPADAVPPDPARERLARILSDKPVAGGRAEPGPKKHPWD